MEKLIELLRESFPLDYDYVENDGHICHWHTDETGEYNRYLNIDSEIISKKFGFIKWLVDNDKIDFEKDKYGMILYENGVQKFIKSEEEIIMELSIQDNPIEFIISILK